MTGETLELARRAGALPVVDRVSLVEQILESLDACDPTLDALWAAEAQDRLEGWRSGSIPAVPAGDAFPER